MAAACLAALAGLGLAAHAQTARWRDSITLYEYTLDISPTNAVVLGNLAQLRLQARRYREAEPLARQALSVLERTAGDAHPYTAALTNNLAQIYRLTGRRRQALPMYERAIAISVPPRSVTNARRSCICSGVKRFGFTSPSTTTK